MSEQIDTLSKYGQSFQSKVVSALLTDNKFLDTISEITTSKFFENDANKWIVNEILDYHTEYRKAPTLDVFKSQLSKVENEILKKTVVEQLNVLNPAYVHHNLKRNPYPSWFRYQLSLQHLLNL